MSWAENKYALNSTLGAPSFAPLDKLTARAVYEHALASTDVIGELLWAFSRLDEMGQTGAALEHISRIDSPTLRACETFDDVIKNSAAINAEAPGWAGSNGRRVGLTRLFHDKKYRAKEIALPGITAGSWSYFGSSEGVACCHNNTSYEVFYWKYGADSGSTLAMPNNTAAWVPLGLNNGDLVFAQNASPFKAAYMPKGATATSELAMPNNTSWWSVVALDDGGAVFYQYGSPYKVARKAAGTATVSELAMPNNTSQWPATKLADGGVVFCQPSPYKVAYMPAGTATVSELAMPNNTGQWTAYALNNGDVVFTQGNQNIVARKAAGSTTVTSTTLAAGTYGAYKFGNGDMLFLKTGAPYGCSFMRDGETNITSLTMPWPSTVNFTIAYADDGNVVFYANDATNKLGRAAIKPPGSAVVKESLTLASPDGTQLITTVTALVGGGAIVEFRTGASSAYVYSYYLLSSGGAASPLQFGDNAQRSFAKLSSGGALTYKGDGAWGYYADGVGTEFLPMSGVESTGLITPLTFGDAYMATIRYANRFLWRPGFDDIVVMDTAPSSQVSVMQRQNGINGFLVYTSPYGTQGTNTLPASFYFIPDLL